MPICKIGISKKKKKKKILPDITEKLFVFGVIRNLRKNIIILKHHSSPINYIKITIKRVYVLFCFVLFCF